MPRDLNIYKSRRVRWGKGKGPHGIHRCTHKGKDSPAFYDPGYREMKHRVVIGLSDRPEERRNPPAGQRSDRSRDHISPRFCRCPSLGGGRWGVVGVGLLVFSSAMTCAAYSRLREVGALDQIGELDVERRQVWHRPL